MTQILINYTKDENSEKRQIMTTDQDGKTHSAVIRNQEAASLAESILSILNSNNNETV